MATLSTSVALAPYPDLNVSNISVGTGTLVTGQQLLVSWSDNNHGDAAASGTWTDTIYLATSATGADAVQVGAFPFAGSLAAGGSFTRTNQVQIPLSEVGTRYVIIKTNAYGSVFQDDFADNSTALAQPIDLAARGRE